MITCVFVYSQINPPDLLHGKKKILTRYRSENNFVGPSKYEECLSVDDKKF